LNEDGTLAEPIPLVERSLTDSCLALAQASALHILKWRLQFPSVSENGTESILALINTILKSAGTILQSDEMKQLSKAFPTSLYKVRKLLGIDRDDFFKYFVCKKCTKIYLRPEIFSQGVSDGKLCHYQPFPDKPSCETVLVKRVKTEKGYLSYPIDCFCYRPLISQLRSMVARPGSLAKFESWRQRVVRPGVYSDIYDGEVWRTLEVPGDGYPFFNQSGDSVVHIGLGCNIDWFQPFKRRDNKSVGAIYVVNLNLPRTERYLPENVFTIGVLPMHGKKTGNHMNHFLEPLVNELLILQNGVAMDFSINGEKISITVRAVLVCICSDIPAARRATAMKNPGAFLGCHVCTRNFKREHGKETGRPNNDFSGRINQSEMRTIQQYKDVIKRLTVPGLTSKQAENIAKETGHSYCVLFKLLYFAPFRNVPPDAMHCMIINAVTRFLKYATSSLGNQNVNLRTVDDRNSHIQINHKHGRVVASMESNMGCLTAQEKKNFVLYHSLYAFADNVMEPRVYQCWQHLVNAIALVTKPVLDEDEIKTMETSIADFFEMAESIFPGKEREPQFSTTNGHLAQHLGYFTRLFGPPSVTWCFAYERLNGLLESVKNNGKTIEMTMMRAMSLRQTISLSSMPVDIADAFAGLSNKFLPEKRSATHNIDLYFLSTDNLQDYSIDIRDHRFELSEKEDSLKLTPVYISCLEIAFQKMYPHSTVAPASLQGRRYSYIKYGDQVMGSSLQGDRRDAEARLMVVDFSPHHEKSFSSGYVPSRIKYYLTVVWKIDGIEKNHIFAACEWFQGSDRRYAHGKHMQLWKFEPWKKKSLTFVPVQKLHCYYAHSRSFRTSGNENVFAAFPITRRVGLGYEATTM